MSRKRVKGEANLSTFFFLITTQIILLLLVGMYAAYAVNINCPDWETQFGAIPYNDSSPVNSLTQVWAFLGVMFSGCSGIPWWLYLIFFVAPIITIIVYIVPFIGD